MHKKKGERAVRASDVNPSRNGEVNGKQSRCEQIQGGLYRICSRTYSSRIKMTAGT